MSQGGPRSTSRASSRSGKSPDNNKEQQADRRNLSLVIDNRGIRDRLPQFKYQQYQRLIKLRKKKKAKVCNVENVLFGPVRDLHPEHDKDGYSRL